MRCVAKLRTPHACCSVMTVTLATTHTAWTRHCSLYPRVAGSASGKEAWALEGPGPEMLEGWDVANMTEPGCRKPGAGCFGASGCLGQLRR